MRIAMLAAVAALAAATALSSAPVPVPPAAPSATASAAQCEAPPRLTATPRGLRPAMPHVRAPAHLVPGVAPTAEPVHVTAGFKDGRLQLCVVTPCER